MDKKLWTAIAIVAVLVIGALVWSQTIGGDRLGDGGSGTGDDYTDVGNGGDGGKPSEEDEDADGIDDVTARDEAVVSDTENMKVTLPDPDQFVSSHWLVIVGEARVFENTVEWRLTDESGDVLDSGFTTADAPDIGQYGDFVIYAHYSATPGERGTVEVFSTSARDGSEENVVTIPVYFGKDREVSIFLTNAEMAGEGNECDTVYAVDRFIFDSEIPAIALSHTIWTLLEGATSEEDADGYASSIPAGVRLNSLHVNDYGAKVSLDFSSEIDAGGSCRVTAIREQIVKTVNEVMGDDYSVEITVDGGSPEEALQP